jgi:predicted esterase
MKQHLPALLTLLALVPGPGLAAGKAGEAPAPVRVVFFLHGRIVEEKGPRPVHPEFGVYEYRKILDAFKAAGFEVRSEVRPAGTDMDRYAARLVEQIHAVEKKGVPPERIAVVGFSKGGGIAIRTAELLHDSHVRFVFLAACGSEPSELRQRIDGRALSIYEASDELGRSCQPLFARGAPTLHHQEVRIDTGKRHGAFFQPSPVWLNPTFAWLRKGEVGGK